MNAEKVNILLVDDQPARLLSYESILHDLGQNLVTACSGTEALERVMAQEFAVILLDVSMPILDGFETAAMIHDHPRYERTPIIFITGVHITELDRLHGYKLGAVDYVSIPVVPEILRGKVAVLVELYCKRRELQLLNISLAEANAKLSEAHLNLQVERNRELEQLNGTLRSANADLAEANVALQNEIRERQRIERTLKEADRHKDEFLAMLAHELRNPLAPIHNAVQLMHRRQLGDPQLEWVRDVIERQSAHLSRLVDDLLDVSRITRGKIRIAREPVQLSAVVARAVETVQPMLNRQEHEFTLSLPSEPLYVLGDLTRLTQVVGNVLSNAIKYTDPRGHVALEACRDGAHVEIRIRDDGIGIAPALMPRIFDLFTQAGDMDERSRGGLGIGLALVKELVQLHEGTVIAQSEGVNRGSEFTIRLPLAQGGAATGPDLEMLAGAGGEPASPDGAVNAGVPGAAAGSRRRILVADDNRDALESLMTLLRVAGHEVYGAADGVEAFERAEALRPDIALLDLGMPRLDGHALARQLRSQAWGESLVLVALTGWGQEHDRRRSRDAGFDVHWVKPLDLQQLTDFLCTLERPEMERPESGEGAVLPLRRRTRRAK
jgi:signal transduction histidine kinase